MLLASTPIFYSAFITLECLTPLSVKADDRDLTLDTRLVRDVNGYPILPGTSIAGVLRSVARQCRADINQLFGQASDSQDIPSQIQVSFGFVHNHQNQPIMGLDMDALESTHEVDRCLKNLMPILRDQVALNEYGVATKGAKMDRTAVPKGTRFSFELNWATEVKNDEQWYKILAWLEHPEFRLGGLTHRGFGKVKVHQIRYQVYDFTQAESLALWQQNRTLSFNAQNGQTHEQQICETAGYLKFSLNLMAEDFWRIGQGDKALGELGQDYTKEPDLKPYTEMVIVWSKSDVPNLESQQVVIPASGIKGALRHRTLFHFRRLMGDLSDGMEDKATFSNSELKRLFGDIQGDGAQVGTLIMDDIYLEKTPLTKIMMHNKIDRFTGGTIDGALFSEQLLYGGGFTLEGKIKESDGHSRQLLEAFTLALKDLAQGRLALGGGSTKGHGYFKADDIDLTQLEAVAAQRPNHPDYKQSEAQSA